MKTVGREEVNGLVKVMLECWDPYEPCVSLLKVRLAGAL